MCMKMSGDDKNIRNDVKGPKGFQFQQKPQTRNGWDGFTHFLWNNETSEFLGRTGISWLKIIVFYILYYSFLSGYFILMLVIFYQTLHDKIPTWQNADGIIGANPGLGFRPGLPDSYIDSTLIHFVHGDESNGMGDWMEWRNRLDKFLEKYKNSTKKEYKDKMKNVISCDYDRLPGTGQACESKVESFLTGPCTWNNSYGYDEGKPCVLVKINKIYGWKPEPYVNSTQLSEVNGAPRGLIDYMKKQDEEMKRDVGESVYIWCEGENPVDVENIGRIDYYPSPVIPAYYFPYLNQEGYLSPVVFAHFTNPKKGVLISIICKAWANNIHHDVSERSGVAHFELMID